MASSAIIALQQVRFFFVFRKLRLMILFSTVLFVEGNPVGYQVKEEARNRLSLNPAENPNRDVEPPVMHACNINGSWKVEGTRDRDLIDQVLEDISLQLPTSRTSAAP